VSSAMRTCGAGKQDLIRDAAKAVFLRAGYGASMDLVAAEAGVSKQTVYNHFGSKEALFRAIMAALGDEFLTVLGEQDVVGKEPRETLTRLAEHVATLLLSPSMLGLHRMLVAEAPRFPDLARQRHTAGLGEGVRRLADYLREQDRRGVLRVPAPDLAAQQFLGALTGNL
jgi:TetR/AcrR family transcriptional regulator, mexJK operon transcriptional repressor